MRPPSRATDAADHRALGLVAALLFSLVVWAPTLYLLVTELD